MVSPLRSHPGICFNRSFTCSGASFGIGVSSESAVALIIRSCAPVVLDRQNHCGHERVTSMANKIVDEEARRQIRTAGVARTYEVERGAIRRFAEAIGDSSPLFNDEAAARRTRFGGMIAPPTFCRSLGSPIPQVRLKGMGAE